VIASVKTDMLPSGAISRLYIANANRHDSGNYTCGKYVALLVMTVFMPAFGTGQSGLDRFRTVTKDSIRFLNGAQCQIIWNRNYRKNRS
jgi:hypothetical protein